MVSAGNGRKITGCYKNGNSEQVKEIFIKIREENLGKIHLSANGGKVVISGITSTLIRMCNNMAESMETEQLLEKYRRNSRFPKHWKYWKHSSCVYAKKIITAGAERARYTIRNWKNIWRKLWQSISGRPHGGRRVWTIRKLFFYLFQGDDGKIF